MGTFLLIVALLLAALLLIAVEVCTPTFGVLGIVAIACVGVMLYLCFAVSGVLGVVMTIVMVFLLPTYLYFVIKYLPKTAVGRILQLRAEKKPAGEGTPEAVEQAAVVGQVATTETLLRPSGAIRVDRRRFIATAESGYIEAGKTVEIVKAIGMNVVVREIEQDA